MPFDGNTALTTELVAPPPVAVSTAFSDLASQPEWTDKLLRKLDRLAELQDDWDSYGAPAIDAHAMRFAAQLAGIVSAWTGGVPLPNVWPTVAGGVQLEWIDAADEYYARLEVDPQRCSWSYSFSTPRGEGEAELAADIAPFLDALKELIRN